MITISFPKRPSACRRRCGEAAETSGALGGGAAPQRTPLTLAGRSARGIPFPRPRGPVRAPRHIRRELPAAAGVLHKLLRRNHLPRAPLVSDRHWATKTQSGSKCPNGPNGEENSFTELLPRFLIVRL